MRLRRLLLPAIFPHISKTIEKLDPENITSSHSAPAMSSATNVGGIRRREATFAVLSRNLSAPHSRTKRAAMKAAMLKQTLS